MCKQSNNALKQSAFLLWLVNASIFLFACTGEVKEEQIQTAMAQTQSANLIQASEDPNIIALASLRAEEIQLEMNQTQNAEYFATVNAYARLMALTPSPTATSSSTPIPTHTLSPGEFPLTATTVINNFHESLGVNCTEPAASKQGGYFWWCGYVDPTETNILRAIFHGDNTNEINYLFSYVLNPWNPTTSQVQFMLELMTLNVFTNSEAKEINNWISEALFDLETSGLDFVTGISLVYELMITPASWCTTFQVGSLPEQGIDFEVIPRLSEFDDICFAILGQSD